MELRWAVGIDGLEGLLFEFALHLEVGLPVFAERDVLPVAREQCEALVVCFVEGGEAIFVELAEGCFDLEQAGFTEGLLALQADEPVLARGNEAEHGFVAALRVTGGVGGDPGIDDAVGRVV